VLAKCWQSGFAGSEPEESKSRHVQVKGGGAKAPSGCEAVLADYSDKQSLRNALHGVTSVYVFVLRFRARELESNMLDACKESR